MADSQRRATLVPAYGLLTGLALHVVATDLPWLEENLARLATVLPHPDGLEPGATFAIVALAGLATLAAAGALWLSPHTGTAFGLLTVATVTWIAFPYAQVPWARLVGGPAGETYAAPASAWLTAAALVALATIEIAASARENVVDELRGRRLVEPDETGEHDAVSSTRWAHRFGLAASLIAAGLIVTVFAVLHPVLGQLGGGLDLLWAPSVAGLVAGGALWLWVRE